MNQEDAGSARWTPERLGTILGRPLPHLRGKFIARVLCRMIVAVASKHVIEVRGLDRIALDRDPFVLALNHNQRPEAVILPTLMIYHRHGKLIHFISDWNFQMIPGIGVIFRSGGVITLTHKPARPRFLNAFRKFYESGKPGLQRAIDLIREGRSIGVFPEGTVNRDPERLLHGHYGAARISLATGAPVIPAGIRFPHHPKGARITDRARFTVEIGPPITPPTPSDDRGGSRDEVRAWHDRVMSEVARLSGKTWEPHSRRAES
ncbi:MAG: 1-acyl-sn-glycerol-3-phosphate acyltransferase [Acidobacteria bacterium]|nr:1-acyl-sn-glycerol-3-phosphate acyltransferase [Acidobacteriota bacterium]